MNKLLLFLISVLFLAAGCNGPKPTSLYSEGTVEFAGKKINVQIADEPDEQRLGLGGRESIGENEGMLFTYDRPEHTSFWMKGMQFPIDIIWIREGKVVDLTLSAQPEPGKRDYELKLYRPKTEIDAVLEVQAGWAIKNNVKIGDPVVIEYKPKQ